MTDVRPILQRYSAGELSAMQVATLLGPTANVADVLVLTLRAGLPLPEPPIERQRAELAHARRVLGMDAE